MARPTIQMLNRLRDVAQELIYDYEVVAIRVQEPEFKLGEISHISSVWVDGEETADTLGGICGISSEFAEIVFNRVNSPGYPGEHVAVIAGNQFTYGEDSGEVIISDPVVVEVLA